MVSKRVGKGKGRNAVRAQPVSAVLTFGLSLEQNGLTALPAGAQNVVLVDVDYLLREVNPILAQVKAVVEERDRAIAAAAKGA